MKNIILLGAPGAGKGTQAELLKQRLHLLHISTGDILRQEISAGTELGQKAQSYVSSGKLVPDDLIIDLIKNRIQGEKIENGIMFDGFPRTVNQAVALDGMLSELNMRLDAVFYLKVSYDVVLKRLTGRRICEKCGAIYHIVNMPPKKEGICDLCGGNLYQRKDDTEEVIKERFEVYEKQTKPLVDYYMEKKVLREVDSDKDAESTFLQVQSLLASL